MFDAPTVKNMTAAAARQAFNVVRAGARFKPAFKTLRVGVVLSGALALSACGGSSDEVQYGDVGYIQGFYGGLAVDEPIAALIGRDILTSGGSAADAAAAISFALSVTYPSAVSIGGGGVCLVNDSRLGLSEVVDFIPPAGSGVQGSRPSAIPTLPRGMAALHARYGRLPWRSVVSPAERLARLGFQVSRAFANELARAADPLYREPSVRAVFAPTGRLLGEGQKLVQPDLAGTLGQIRAGGAGVVYSGRLARRIVEGVQEAGGTLTYAELNAYTPELRLPIIVPFGDDEMHFAPPPAAAGPMLANMWRLLLEDDLYADASAQERPHILAEVMKRAGADRKNWIAPGFTTSIPLEDVVSAQRVRSLMSGYDPNRATPGRELDPQARQLVEVISGTGFVVLDSSGMSVACNLSLYNPFGTGRIAGDTGILLAAAPGLRGRNPLGLGPAIAVNSNTLRFKFAVASGGGPLAPAGMIQTMADTLLANEKLDQVIAKPRLLAVDSPDTVLVETEGGDELAAVLQSKGHPVSRLTWQGRVNAVHCPLGIRPDRTREAVCGVVHDPRGNGLSPYSDGGS
ncbi:MAG: gamma-glutamyltransferase [Alphaproteobacteria bacterium]|uniref:gamma-glutamyltransferase n=1 Tax=Pacificispira sp. TaxID=2888761 RepID=UPI001B2D5AD3|nr:gamma-glutamyltransferase [Alphaproteobacteria bacterium]MBO6863102.1 gamma-glutamyltransferase [Alphaproteobacteria bacterium]MEC9268417.1 gamma-glutamyltransferase [Pseudomonadota bacterium]